MATEEERTSGEKNDDLRELLAMIAVIVGSRVQRDVDGRDDADGEADALLAEIRDKLRALLVRREEAAEPRALYLALVQELADVYRTVPNSKKPIAPHAASADWQAYSARVADVLSAINGASATKIGEWCLSRDQIARPRNYRSPTHHSGGAVEAARAAVADVLGISARTLVHWERRDKVRPNDVVGPRGALLYGDTVHFPDAVADVVELLALDDEFHAPVPERAEYVEVLRAQGLPCGGERTWQDDIIDADEDE